MTLRFSGGGAAVWSLLLLTRVLHAQVVNPADAQARPDEPKEADPWSTERLRSWELPPVTVEGERVPELREEELIGSYSQPRWTATRRDPPRGRAGRPGGRRLRSSRRSAPRTRKRRRVHQRAHSLGR